MARYCGANVDFVDINAETYNIDPILLEKKLIEAKKNNVLPKIVIPVHLCGHSADMEQIYLLAKNIILRLSKMPHIQLGLDTKNILWVVVSILLVPFLVFIL